MNVAQFLLPFIRSGELRVIGLGFLVGMAWCIWWCYTQGYHLPAGEVEKTFGLPSWVFWGILVPWLVSDIFIGWFCFAYMQDDPLGEAGDELAEDQPHGAEDLSSPAGSSPDLSSADRSRARGEEQR